MSVRGWVYVMTNESMPGLVKVGFSTKDPSLRASELDGTGVPTPWCVAYDALVIEPRKVEGLAHKHLSGLHHAKEFFRCSVEVAVAAIRANAEIILENGCSASEHSGLVQENVGIVHPPAVSESNGSPDTGLKKQSNAVGGYVSPFAAGEMYLLYRQLPFLGTRNRNEIAEERAKSDVKQSSQPSLQQQAQEWIERRDRITNPQPVDGIRPMFQNKRDMVNPDYLEEPLRSEVNRQLASPQNTRSPRPELSAPELVAHFQRASAYAHRSDVEPTDGAKIDANGDD